MNKATLLLAVLLLAGCARIKQNMATYDAAAKARQPKREHIAFQPPEKFTLVTVVSPPAELKVVYKSNAELTGLLTARESYKRMNETDKVVELKMIPAGGLVKVLEKNYEEGNEYSVELFAHTFKIGSCANDLSNTFLEQFDSDVERAYVGCYTATLSLQGLGANGGTCAVPNLKVSCPVAIANPDTLYVHVHKNGSRYAVYQLTVRKDTAAQAP
ncbi:MAG: hypothetical protein JWO30_339 [Fibrobacteres bacterium]|nr:hypothetical protein [Fibrobacterota bacterium]